MERRGTKPARPPVSSRKAVVYSQGLQKRKVHPAPAGVLVRKLRQADEAATMKKFESAATKGVRVSSWPNRDLHHLGSVFRPGAACPRPRQAIAAEQPPIWRLFRPADQHGAPVVFYSPITYPGIPDRDPVGSTQVGERSGRNIGKCDQPRCGSGLPRIAHPLPNRFALVINGATLLNVNGDRRFKIVS